MSFAAKRNRFHATRAAAVVLLLSAIAVADEPAAYRWCPPPQPTVVPDVSGRVLILPGVGNTSFHLAGFVASVEQQLPAFDVEVRTWGLPFLTIHNLRAHERNLATAQQLAAEIAALRRAEPDKPFYLVGYSGGGGLATLVVAALPDDVTIDRLILVAPAISPDYPLDVEVLPHVREFAANFASRRDLQVGWGTRTFGTIDRQYTPSAGAVGFTIDDKRLLQYHWSAADLRFGHAGNHLAYLGHRWQAEKLLPLLDPRLAASAVKARWARGCRESQA